MNPTHGFTLIEILVTIAIAAILMTMAIPGFQDFFVNNRLATQSNELVASLHLAKSESIRRGARVTVCKSSNLTTCDTAATWTQGRIVFVDYQDGQNNRPGAYGTINSPAAGIYPADQIIRVYGPLSRSTLTVGANFANRLSFLPNGSARGTDDGLGNDTFVLCTANVSRSIAITSAGRVRVTTGTC